MFVEKDLLDAFGTKVDAFRSPQFSNFSGEVPFIRETIKIFDDINISRSGQSLQTKAKEYHSSTRAPFYVSYNRPNWVKNSDTELADLLFVANYHNSKGIVKRRAMLSQSKYTSGSGDSVKDWKWPISMHQYILLRGVAQFTIEEPDTGETFYITPNTSSFVNYSFASDFELPFFYSLDQMDQHLMSVRGTKETTFDQLHGSVRPSDLQYLFSVSKRFIAETWGEQFNRGDEIYRLIEHVFNHVEFFTSKSSPKMPDGGWVSDRDDPHITEGDDGEPPDPELDQSDGYSLGIVQIDISPTDHALEDHDGFRLRG